MPLRSDRATGWLQSILYLKSAAFVTGEILNGDGGQSAGHWRCDPTGSRVGFISPKPE
jgi:hypothetical protein